jgi:hypothetical protein
VGHKHKENIQHLREINDPEWRDFCNGPFREYEIKWTKRIEDYVREREEAEAAN